MSKARKFSNADCFRVRSLYDNFLRRATALIGKHGVKFDASNIDEKLFVSKISADRIVVQTKSNCGFWFSGLPRKKDDKSHVIDVCLSLNQQIAPGNKAGLLLYASNVHVSYFECTQSPKYNILESWHFDFAPEQAGHPVFHAQLTGDHVPPSANMREYDPKFRVPALKDLPRVPTPPLDLAAVMEIIIADHLIDFQAIADDEDWRNAASGLPQLPMTHIAAWKLPVDKLKARHWYPAS